MLAFPAFPVFPMMSALAVLAGLTERSKRDLDLLGRIQRRDERALAALYDQYGSLLYTMALRIVNAAAEAEDIVQEVFVQVWSKSNLYVKERGSVYSWIVALCRNRAIDRVRSKRFKQQSKEVKLDDAMHAADLFASNNPHQAVVLKEYGDVIAAAKSKLSDIEVKILDMSYFGGYSQTEISQMLKMPLGTVKTKMRVGMLKLRQAITGDSSNGATLNSETNDEGAVQPAQEEQQPEQSGHPGEGERTHHAPRRHRGRRGGRNRRRGGHSGSGHSRHNPGKPPGGEGGSTS